MDFWQRARSFAEEAAKRSQELTIEAAKRSQDFTIGSSKLSEIVSEASKRADQIKVEALKRADQIKAQIPPAAALSSLVEASLETTASTEAAAEDEAADLEKFGVTDELREFVKSITMNTFRDFPLEDACDDHVLACLSNISSVFHKETESFSVKYRCVHAPDDSEMSDIPTVSNVRQDLTAWQERHAKLVLSTVKFSLWFFNVVFRNAKNREGAGVVMDSGEGAGLIADGGETSKLRYELCPRVMKERKFWRIYFILVNSHVAPYERRYMEEARLKAAEQAKDDKKKEASTSGTTSETERGGINQKSKTSPTSEQDLDVFLLGDLGDSDDGPDDGDGGGFDDDFDKI
ncbi:hypothetical protein TEA_016473 [Camellia sinensis var. sinensis]|uniref:BSD domain-containing protein n=1 Tax=Camellia sinensis var. sinensis TaxID=542762 RepID=A0A4S4CXF1_CAMSN|nr:hypothetical protein TEA_016473 [Camellia sinensis var. sinensis]